jgi:hypothetical protein
MQVNGLRSASSVRDNEAKNREQRAERASVIYRGDSDKVSSEKKPGKATHKSTGPAAAGGDTASAKVLRHEQTLSGRWAVCLQPSEQGTEC